MTRPSLNLTAIPELRETLGVAANLQAAGMTTSAHETGKHALRVLLRALGASDDAVWAVEQIIECDDSYEQAVERGQVVEIQLSQCKTQTSSASQSVNGYPLHAEADGTRKRRLAALESGQVPDSRTGGAHPPTGANSAESERAELLERLVSDREEYFSPERDVRSHDSHARRAG